ncbi:MAG: UDP-glucose 6-dehydrogenase [Candidatus Omnitrophica bacterium CG12_big_fil_rev_8_21_14_0_65_43_15]|uniref:UDP-glucose 6-dehydrogenase n=1 Tax=Candidatus Taenaricola geysiri TaxID=1974752 RepID=A0A2J0LF30_9BACT|nr:MAG: UDP-glucose 6-dehydrogenase [Candidatus Omnitrophica bacterium CG10_big_fil_rev_8_21_14_0_10_43_8]PIV11952.1 MAG: UDP-glucose 6-dehydrogenase [Candidatus Omnitrophica bacterium CG03_land_8_20_14_0_80_43_22]PIW65809.1 MAG: UDP-glucose 6-dehydrogenase [Candidatus Omnitrophica bacterium CG12_big_fil_rev_8_21_14_0_65_43_15]PJC46137.1 MAG: UDP-glucose 6-dehydrogenase [Candidatus Omnitrophica bacterium CG_4_9_14_0_2_um_filter_43_12]
MKITVVGSGYVGLVTGACFADLGNDVFCVDNDKAKIASLKKGIMPIFEPGLEEMVLRNYKAGRLKFTTDIKTAAKKSTVIFIAVGTPPKPSGEPDLSSIEAVTRQVASVLDSSYKIIVEKSTVPVETGEWVKYTLSINSKKKANFDVASNPEFLREGSAINDFMHPDRIVLGVESKSAKETLLALFEPFKAPVIVTDIKSAELIKHASNSFLAAKISFINAIANICDKTGADVTKVAEGMGMDKRIGKSFLNAGAGWGGFCFPKDMLAFIHISEKLGYDFKFLKEAYNINEEQKKIVIEKIRSSLWNFHGKTVAVLGLAFKPNTDDIRLAVSLDIIDMLLKEGAKIKVYDPKAMKKAKEALDSSVVLCKDAYDAAKGSDCLLVLTEWPEFTELDFGKLKKLLRLPIVMDARNMYDPAVLKKLGFKYTGIGRR